MIYHCSKSASKVLNILTNGLNDQNLSRKIDNSSGAFMSVHVEFLFTDDVNGVDMFSVAHFYEQNGDLMKDPDVVFLREKNDSAINEDEKYLYIPISFQQDNLGIYQEFFQSDNNGKFITVNAKQIRDCIEFCTMWMKNIEEQQGLK